MNKDNTLVALLIIILAVLSSAFVAFAGPSGQLVAPQPVHDDAPALQWILNRSNTVVKLKPGTYHTATPIVLQNVHDLTVRAYEANLVASPNQPIGSRDTGDTIYLKNCQRVRIIGLNIDANRDGRGGFNQESQGIDLYQCSDITLRDCNVNNAVGDGVFAWGGFAVPANLACQRVHLQHCRIDNPGRNCVSFVGAAWSDVTDCDLCNATTSEPKSGVDIESNVGDGDGSNHHISITGDRIGNIACAVKVIRVANPTNITISGNLVDHTSSDALFNEGHGTLITGNVVSNYGTVAVSSCNGGTAIIANNWGAVYAEAGNVVDGVKK